MGDAIDPLQRLGLALAIGFLVGIERGWRERNEAEGGRTAGLRTFALAGLLGGIAGMLAREIGGLALVALGAPFALAISAFKWRENIADQTYSVTTVVAALIVFALGAYAAVGSMVVAAAAGVATTGLLALRGVLHDWLRRLEWTELRALLVLLAMTFVALPILPNRPIDPFGAFNPHRVWLMTIVIGLVGFAGYLGIRLAGERIGLLLSGAAGALVSSTAVTMQLARRSRDFPDRARLHAGVALVATGIALLRTLAIAGVAHLPLALALLAPLGAAALAALAIGAALAMAGDSQQVPLAAPGNPLDLGAVLTFGALLGFLLVASRLLSNHVGAEGLYALGMLAGLADTDAMALSLATLAREGTPLSLAGPVLLATVATNSVVKIAIGFAAGARSFALAHAAGYVAPVGVGLLALLRGW